MVPRFLQEHSHHSGFPSPALEVPHAGDHVVLKTREMPYPVEVPYKTYSGTADKLVLQSARDCRKRFVGIFAL